VLGAVSGAVNGVLVSVLGLPSLAVTIGTLALYRGLAFVVLGDQAVTSFPRAITSGLQAKIGASGIPVWIIPVIILAIIFGVVLHFTGFGRSLFAIGYSEEAARFAGIRVAQSKFWLFIISGAVAALVGIWWTLRYGSARGDNATGLELSVIAAVLLGGVSIFGGKGNLPGVIAGVVLLGILRNALQLARVPEDTLSMLTGGLLILAVVAPNAIAWSRTLSRRTSTP
jgi:rhamnose transport system permease protein